jgi:hypothetical protein
LAWITVGGLAMTVIGLSGSLTLLLPERSFDRVVPPLVALAAGSLIGGPLGYLILVADGVHNFIGGGPRDPTGTRGLRDPRARWVEPVPRARLQPAEHPEGRRKAELTATFAIGRGTLLVIALLV